MGLAYPTRDTWSVLLYCIKNCVCNIGCLYKWSRELKSVSMVQTVDAYFQHFFQSALFCALSTHAHTTQVCTQHTGALNIHITCTEHIHARTHVHSQHMCTTTHRNIHVVLEAKNACLACICRVDGHTQLAWCALGQGVLHHGVWLKHPGGLEHITTFSVHRKLSSGTSESVCMRERERVCVYMHVCVYDYMQEHPVTFKT